MTCHTFVTKSPRASFSFLLNRLKGQEQTAALQAGQLQPRRPEGILQSAWGNSARGGLPSPNQPATNSQMRTPEGILQGT
jgi:hypothetical protein